jgi:hypothetical protein
VAALHDEVGAADGVPQGQGETDGPDRHGVYGQDRGDQRSHGPDREQHGVDSVATGPAAWGFAAGLAADLLQERVAHPEREQAEQHRRKDRMGAAGDRGDGCAADQQRETADGPDPCAAPLPHGLFLSAGSQRA